jgi:hypothetical protein
MIANFIDKPKAKLLILLGFYALTLVFLQFFLGWYQNFSDATHYLWISDKYAEADWKNAINTYWGPMISWLLLLLKPIIIEPFVRFRILQIILGAIAIVLISKILNKKLGTGGKHYLFILAIVPIISSYAWFYLTPDLLLLCGILLLVNTLINYNETSKYSIVKLALIGAILFFIKSIGLYLFVLIIAGKFVFERNQWNWKSLIINLKIAFLTLLFVAPWIYLISQKHGSFTLGTGAEHNYKMNSPRVTPNIYGEQGNPYHNGKLLEPKPANSFDSWIEPLQESYMSWEGYSGAEIGSVYKQIIIKNLKSARSMYFGLDVGTLFLFLFFIALIVWRKKAVEFIKEEKVLFFIFAGNIILYLPFFFMDRYTWPGVMALFLLFVLLVAKLELLSKNWFVLLSFGLIVGLAAILLNKEIKYTLPEKAITTQIWNTKGELKLKRCVWLTDSEDKRLGLVKGLIYYNKGQYLGALFTNQSTLGDNRCAMNEFNIDHIISFKALDDSLKKWYDITETVFNSDSLLIYKHVTPVIPSKKKVRNWKCD